MHYAWIVLIVCCLLEVGSLGTVLNCSGLFLNSVCEAFNIRATAFSIYIMMQNFSTAATAIFCKKLVDKCGIKKMVLLAAFVTCGCVIGFSQASSIWMFYVLAVFLGIAINMLMILPVPLLITNWFGKRQGTAMGIAAACGGIGGACSSVLLSNIIMSMGWRAGYLGMAAITAVCILPATFLLLKDHPSQKNLLPYGFTADEAALSQETVGKKDDTVMNYKELLTNKKFWMVFFLACFATYICSYIIYLSSYAESLQYTVVIGGMLISCAMLGDTLGAVILGYLVDMFGVAKVETVSIVLLFVASIILIMGWHFVPCLMIGAFILGISDALYIAMSPLLVEDIFGRKHYGAIYSVVASGCSFTLAITCTLIGLFYDLSGGYVLGFSTITVICILMLIITVLLYRNKKQP